MPPSNGVHLPKFRVGLLRLETRCRGADLDQWRRQAASRGAFEVR